MIRRYLGNYNSFACAGGNCSDTCCSGWMIEIDDASLEKYALLRDQEPELFNDKIDWELDTFIRRENGDCAFLREDGLCQLQRTLGEEALCLTCDKYPRHKEEFPDVREYSLSISCPEVAKEFVCLSEPLAYTEESDTSSDLEEYDEFNEQLYGQLLQVRGLFFNLLNDEAVSFEEKALRITSALTDIQEQLDFGQWNNCTENVERILNTPVDGKPASAYEQAVNSFETFLKLEPLREGFICWVKEANALVNSLNSEAFNNSFSDFRGSLSWLEQLKTNLCCYFLFTYFCGAVYDDYVFALGQQAVFNTQFIETLLFSKWLQNKKSLSPLEASEIIYKYSRELEHSNENLILLEQLLDEI
ncbi:MAG: hypothetical protein HUJ98_11190 [Bacteroidaceae bacterium]|nr:hypothetical protein [Bacteroidaceae bacterium]